MSNTVGGTHNYWLRPDPASRTFRAAATKSLYVSPFMPVDLEYTFAFTPPTGRLVAHMETSQAGSVGFDATLSLERRPWSAAEIRRVLVRYPAMTATGDGRDSLGGAEIVVERRARRATRHGGRRRGTRGPRRRAGGARRFVEGVRSMLTQWAKTAFLSGLDGVTGGTLTVACPDRTYRFGEPGELDAVLWVHDERFFLRALMGGDIGVGESFMDGDWTTPDLVPWCG